MSETMISVENVGKLYTLRHKVTGERYATFRDVITRGVLAPFRAISGKGRNGAKRQRDGGLLGDQGYLL